MSHILIDIFLGLLYLAKSRRLGHSMKLIMEEVHCEIYDLISQRFYDVIVVSLHYLNWDIGKKNRAFNDSFREFLRARLVIRKLFSLIFFFDFFKISVWPCKLQISLKIELRNFSKI